MKQRLLTLLVGIVLGMMLLSGGYAATSAVLTASPTTQTFYVDGRQVQFEAYEIHGNNFVKLRDIGRIVDFGVTYDGATNTVHIAPDSPYIEEVTPPAPATPAPSVTPAPTTTGSYTINTDHWSREDFSQQANPAVFTGIYDRALYNTIRQTLVDGVPGDAPAYTMVSQTNYSAIKNLVGRLSGMVRYEHYVPENFTNYWQYLDYFAVSATVPDNYLAAQEFIQPTIAQAVQLASNREKVEYLHDYLCSLLVYDAASSVGVTRIFSTNNGNLKASCGSYAVAFKFLCQAANIPCISVSSKNHTWNIVYVDGRWLYIDASADDLHGNKNALLVETYPKHTDVAPEATAFLKELLVPGSTK